MLNITYILPEIFLAISIMSLLMVGIFVKKSFKLVNFLTIIILIFTSAMVLNQSGEVVIIFNDSYIIDKFSTFFIKSSLSISIPLIVATTF